MLATLPELKAFSVPAAAVTPLLSALKKSADSYHNFAKMQDYILCFSYREPNAQSAGTNSEYMMVEGERGNVKLSPEVTSLLIL